QFANPGLRLQPPRHADLHHMWTERPDVRDDVDVTGTDVRPARLHSSDRLLDVAYLRRHLGCRGGVARGLEPGHGRLVVRLFLGEPGLLPLKLQRRRALLALAFTLLADALLLFLDFGPVVRGQPDLLQPQVVI